MDKKLIGLMIVIIIAVVTVSGCIGDENTSMNTQDNNHQINDDTSQDNQKDSVSGNNDKDTKDNKQTNNKNNNNADPEPNEEPEPPAEELSD